MKTLSLERLREVLNYNPDTGVFIWRVARGRGVRPGDIAGYLDNNGYRRVTVDRQEFLASRAAWFYVHGRWPDNEMDHKNGRRADDRLDNLREVTHSGNQQNKRTAMRNNKAGMLGVSPSKKNWAAYIKLGGKTRRLGTFSTPELAHAAYVSAKRALHEGCTL